MYDGKVSRQRRRRRRRRWKKKRREHGGVCMNGAKPGASACFWVKGGAGVLGGQSINWSLGDRRREESGEWELLLLLLSIVFTETET